MPEKTSSLVWASVLTSLAFFAGFFLYAKWGPGFPLSVNQVTTTKSNLFTVTGESKVYAKPDIAEISLGITANGASIGQVQNQANQIINKVIRDIKGQGISEADIKTTGYNLRPDYNYNGNQQRIVGYIADVNILVKVRDFDKINDVIDLATAAGANQVGGLTFTLDDATKAKAKSEARKMAINKARQKATEIASETGISLGRIIDVQEGGETLPRPIPVMAQAGGTESKTSTQIQPGQNETSMTISLSYEIR